MLVSRMFDADVSYPVPDRTRQSLLPNETTLDCVFVAFDSQDHGPLSAGNNRRWNVA